MFDLGYDIGMTKPKVLIIGYGGTIVMVVDPERRAVVPAKNIETIIELIPNLNQYVDTEMAVLSNKDSTNVGPDDWTRLAQYIQKRYHEFDGFVITHGTNTLSYTATALSFAFGKRLAKPVVLTGSQLPLTVYGNDARFNFENTLRVAGEAIRMHIGEVMIVFNDKILRGNRSVKVSESAFSAFDTPAYPLLGRISSTGVHFAHDLIRTRSEAIDFTLRASYDRRIFSFDLVPGQTPEMIMNLVVNDACRGVIIKSHGAGSVPTEGEASMLPIIHQLTRDHGIPVIVASRFLGGNASKEINDEPAILAIEAGAISAGDMTDIASEVKLMWLLGRGKRNIDDIRKLMQNNYVGETTT